MSKLHAELSASGSERWLNCPASVKLSRGLPEPPESSYAIEGTTAHNHLETWLNNYWLLDTDLSEKTLPPGEMRTAIKKCVDIVKRLSPLDMPSIELFIEKKVSLSHIQEGMFGTADIVIAHYSTKRLYVLDYKHGKGVLVEPSYEVEGRERLNTQLAYYGVGALRELGVKKFNDIVLGIVQPRAANAKGLHMRTTTISVDELLKYEYFFKQGVKRVYSANPKPFEGPWCHWCRAKEVCPLKQTKKFNEVVEFF